jgi:hypothetical protein
VRCSAYELYADPKTGRPEADQVESSLFKRLKQMLRLAKKDTPAPGAISLAERFKRAFSRTDVKVHFVGAWYVIHAILDGNFIFMAMS